MLNGTAKDIQETSQQLILGTEHSSTETATRNRCWSGIVWVLQRPDICKVHPVYIQCRSKYIKGHIQRVCSHALKRSFLMTSDFFFEMCPSPFQSWGIAADSQSLCHPLYGWCHGSLWPSGSLALVLVRLDFKRKISRLIFFSYYSIAWFSYDLTWRAWRQISYMLWSTIPKGRKITSSPTWKSLAVLEVVPSALWGRSCPCDGQRQQRGGRIYVLTLKFEVKIPRYHRDNATTTIHVPTITTCLLHFLRRFPCMFDTCWWFAKGQGTKVTKLTKSRWTFTSQHQGCASDVLDSWRPGTLEAETSTGSLGLPSRNWISRFPINICKHEIISKQYCTLGIRQEFWPYL